MKIRAFPRSIYNAGVNSIFRARYPVLSDSFRIKSHLTVKERVTLYRLSKISNTIAEIGSYVGASACCFGAAVEPRSSGKIYCIDTWNNDAMTEGGTDTWKEFQHNTENYEESIVPIRGFSTDVIDDLALRIKSLDLLFIDGDHSYEGVKADWETYKQLLKPGSIVVFHDWGWAEGVKRVINEDVRPVISDYGSLPNMWWGTIEGVR